MDENDHNRGAGGPPGPTDPLVLATTDPAIAAEADHQAEWKRHPFATIRLETTPAGGPELLAAASPWAIDPAPAPGPRPGAGTNPPATPAAPPEPAAEPVRDARGLGDGPDAGPGDTPTARLATPPARPAPRARVRPATAWHPWVVAGAAMVGGLIGSVGYLHVSGACRCRTPIKGEGRIASLRRRVLNVSQAAR